MLNLIIFWNLLENSRYNKFILQDIRMISGTIAQIKVDKVVVSVLTSSYIVLL